jgi:3-keto-disaccharide hydrolase
LEQLLRQDKQRGMGGWGATNDWHIVNGMLVNDGTQHASNGNPTAFAPYPPQDIANYSVQAEIRLDKYTDEGTYATDSFGIAVRYSDNNGGYKLGACAGAPGLSFVTPCDSRGTDVFHVLILSDGDFSNDKPVKKVPFQPGYGNWHTYRIDVNGNTITVWIDGGMMFQVTDDKFLSAGQVGLWSDRCQISVRSFTITAL